MSKSAPYRQHLPGLALSIERNTDAVPDDGGWYLLRDGVQVGRYRSLRAAQQAWGVIIQDSGWQPKSREMDAAAARRREAVERWARNRAG